MQAGVDEVSLEPAAVQAGSGARLEGHVGISLGSAPKLQAELSEIAKRSLSESAALSHGLFQ